VQVFRDGIAAGTTQADAQGHWTFNCGAPLADGTYTFTASASDVAGNVSDLTPRFRVTIDTVGRAAPTIVSVRSDASVPGRQTLWVSGSAAAHSTVVVFLAGKTLGTAAADDKGNWTYGYTAETFAAGTYEFTATTTAVDIAGNAAQLSKPFTLMLGSPALDLAAPVLDAASVLSVDAQGNIKAAATPTFTGTAQPGTVVTILNGNTVLGTAVADSSGKWQFTCPKLAGGHYSITVFATDAAGDCGLLSAALLFEV
jgi:hypothetical protein